MTRNRRGADDERSNSNPNIKCPSLCSGRLHEIDENSYCCVKCQKRLEVDPSDEDDDADRTGVIGG